MRQIAVSHLRLVEEVEAAQARPVFHSHILDKVESPAHLVVWVEVVEFFSASLEGPVYARHHYSLRIFLAPANVARAERRVAHNPRCH